ncbi:MAG: hypothetical protein AABW93_02385 [Nanoarchaeota archaeon]
MEEKGEIVKVRTAKSNEEFFELLHQKAQKDLKRIFEEKEFKFKVYAVAEMMANMNAVIDAIEKHGNINFFEHYNNRVDKIGLLDKRLVLVSGLGINADIIKKILEYGEKHNYPSIVINKDENGNTYKQIGSGKEAWMAAISWADLSSPHNENFDDFAKAVTNAELGG